MPQEINDIAILEFDVVSIFKKDQIDTPLGSDIFDVLDKMIIKLDGENLDDLDDAQFRKVITEKILSQI